jgi:hypothetical protein
MSATITAPDRTTAQRMDALDRANMIRSARAELKRDLKARRKHLVPLLTDPPGWLGSMKILDLLLATPKVGRVKANRVLSRARVSPSKTLGGLSQRQRLELVALLKGARV